MNKTFKRVGALTFAGFAALIQPAFGQQLAVSALTLELNKIEAVGPGCRTTWVIRNSTGQDIDRVKVDLVAFDKDGIVAIRLGAEMGGIRNTHTRVKLFDLKQVGCGSLGRLLMNEILVCQLEGTTGAKADLCDLSLVTSSKSNVPFTQ